MKVVGLKNLSLSSTAQNFVFILDFVVFPKLEHSLLNPALIFVDAILGLKQLGCLTSLFIDSHNFFTLAYFTAHLLIFLLKTGTCFFRGTQSFFVDTQFQMLLKLLQEQNDLN